VSVAHATPALEGATVGAAPGERASALRRLIGGLRRNDR
jgi:hypothetical protein